MTAVPISIASANDIAGMSPFNVNVDVTVTTTGTYNYTFFTVPSGKVYYICTTFFYYYAGTANNGGISIHDAAVPPWVGATIHGLNSPTINTYYTAQPHAYSAPNTAVAIDWGITGQPFKYHVEMSGLMLTI